MASSSSSVILPDGHLERQKSRVWVIAAVSNPAQWKSRYALYRQFRTHITEELGVNLCTIECALGAGGFHAIPEGPDDDPDVAAVLRTVGAAGAAGAAGYTAIGKTRGRAKVQTLDVRVRNQSWIWLKENLMNVAVKHLPSSAEYLLFCDADIRFCNPHVIEEMIYALSGGTFAVVQPFETCADLGHEGQILAVHQSFGSCHAKGMTWNPVIKKKSGSNGVAYGVYDRVADTRGPFFHAWHPGYCMAMCKKTYVKLGGLLEVGVAGAGDHHMMTAMIGRSAESYPSTVGAGYKAAVTRWEERAAKYVRGNLGFVPGTIHHAHHGPKKNRAYIARWNILTKNAFDPDRDVSTNADGVLELSSGNKGLRDDLRRYFLSRNEDDVNNA